MFFGFSDFTGYYNPFEQLYYKRYGNLHGVVFALQLFIVVYVVILLAVSDSIANVPVYRK